MRNFRVINIIQRLNHLNKSSAFLTKSSNLSSSLTKRPLIVGEENANFSQSKRYSSSGGGSHGNDFNRSALLYTLLGGSIIAGSFAFASINSPSKPQLETPKPVSRSNNNEAEKQEGEEEETEAVVVEESIQTETASKPANDEEEISETPEIFTEVPSEATKLDDENFLPEIPSHAQYLIVGGGTAAMSAFKAIRAKDPTAKVLVITEENYNPYMRPPLSKDLWTTDDEKLIEELKFKQYNGNERSLLFLEDEFYVKPKFLNTEACANGGVAVVTGKRVTEIDIEGKKVRLDNNWEVAYEKCLLATGGKPKNLPVFEKSWEKFKNNVTLFRNIADFKRLYAIAKEGKNIVIVGGGFLGSELACALAHMSKKYGGTVTQVYPEAGNLSKILPEYLSKWTTKRVKEEGVTIIPKATVSNAQIDDGKISIILESLSQTEGPKTKWLVADHVVVAVGLDPNVQLASKSGFETDPKLGGYVVNAELQARHGVWAAGDAACFYDVKLGRRRVEHHDHAVVSGRLAGENMTGAGKPYWHQSMFWSDLGPNIGFEAIGLVDSSLQTVGLFAKADEEDTPAAQVKLSNETLRSEVKDGSPAESTPEPQTPKENDEFGKGVVLYLKNDKIVGVLLWNVFKAVPIARQLIQSNDKVTDFKEIAKLFKINATGEESN